MDAAFFLKRRTAFVRFYYDAGVASFQKIQSDIETGQAPFDNPLYDESGEPPFLEEWMEAKRAIEVHGQASVALLSDSLKLFFETLRKRVIRFSWGAAHESILKGQGFVAAYKNGLGEILQTDWSDCSANFEIIEQVVLARNSGQHGTYLTHLDVELDAKTLKRFPSPFFTTDADRQLWLDAGGSPDSLFARPVLRVSRTALFASIEEIEKLADWIDRHLDRAADWRSQRRSEQQK